jgi:hypothetical protein
MRRGLLLRIAVTTETPLARLPDETVFEDYRDVDGVKLPFTIRASFVDPFVGWTRKFTEIKITSPSKTRSSRSPWSRSERGFDS